MLHSTANLRVRFGGNLINAWGGPVGAHILGESNHGIDVAPNGDIWISGNSGPDSHVLVFTRDGEYVRTVGVPEAEMDSNSTTSYGRVAEIAIDAANNEVYFADGYRISALPWLILRPAPLRGTEELMETARTMRLTLLTSWRARSSTVPRSSPLRYSI